MPKLYTVVGNGEFPRDMLRRDMSAFATPADEAAAGTGFVHGTRTVALRIPDDVRSRPNAARWASFGWNVARERSAEPAPASMPGGEEYHSLMLEIRRLRAALKPFANASAQFERGPGGNLKTDRLGGGLSLTVGDLWNAADAVR